jgi:TRAP-type C4-dicarboxylate transport system substrate-binding protein
LQWHTKVKYITEFPLSYTLGFMAVDKRAFDKISPADQAIVREVMERTYDNFNRQNLIDNQEALQALINAGIESVPVDPDEFQKVRAVVMESNRRLGREGHFSLDVYDEMLGYIEDYRNEQQASAGPSR